MAHDRPMKCLKNRILLFPELQKLRVPLSACLFVSWYLLSYPHSKKLSGLRRLSYRSGRFARVHKQEQRHGLQDCRNIRHLAINSFSMPNLYHPNCELLILNGIDDPVFSLTDAKSFLPREFFVARRSRVFRKRFNAKDNFHQIFFGYRAEVFFDGRFEKDFISCHLFSAS